MWWLIGGCGASIGNVVAHGESSDSLGTVVAHGDVGTRGGCGGASIGDVVAHGGCDGSLGNVVLNRNVVGRERCGGSLEDVVAHWGCGASIGIVVAHGGCGGSLGAVVAHWGCVATVLACWDLVVQNNGKNAQSPKSVEKSERSTVEQGHNVTYSWNQKFYWDALFNCDNTTSFLGLQCHNFR
jgi:hypothetical protein